MSLLSWIKGLLGKEKKVTHTTLRQKIKDLKNLPKLIENTLLIDNDIQSSSDIENFNSSGYTFNQAETVDSLSPVFVR